MRGPGRRRRRVGFKHCPIHPNLVSSSLARSLMKGGEDSPGNRSSASTATVCFGAEDVDGAEEEEDLGSGPSPMGLRLILKVDWADLEDLEDLSEERETALSLLPLACSFATPSPSFPSPPSPDTGH